MVLWYAEYVNTASGLGAESNSDRQMLGATQLKTGHGTHCPYSFTVDEKREFTHADRDRVQGGCSEEVGLGPSRLYTHILQRPATLLSTQADPNRIGYKRGIFFVVEPGGMLTEEEEDLADALSPINDQLSFSPISVCRRSV